MTDTPPSRDRPAPSVALGDAGPGPDLDRRDPRPLDPQRRGPPRQRPGRRRPDAARRRPRPVAMALSRHAPHGHPALALLVSAGPRLRRESDHAGQRRDGHLAPHRRLDVLAGVEGVRPIGGGLGDRAAGLLVDRDDLALGPDHRRAPAHPGLAHAGVRGSPCLPDPGRMVARCDSSAPGAAWGSISTRCSRSRWSGSRRRRRSPGSGARDRGPGSCWPRPSWAG